MQQPPHTPCQVDKCDPSLLTSQERQVLAAYWRFRGEGEMGAERFFKRLLGDMRVLGVDAAIQELAQRGPGDERKHGLWGRDWAVFFGDEDRTDPEATRTRELTFPGATPFENRILRLAFCCFTETVGCHTLTDVRPRITFPPLRELNRTHLADETIHARIGWAYLSSAGKAERATIQRFLPALLGFLPIACCEGHEEDQYEHLVPLGYLTPRVLHGAHQRALREVIFPGLEHLGFETSHLRGALKGAA